MSVKKLSLRKKLALELFAKYRLNENKIHKLSYILWECTLKCNLNCLHCGSDCKKDSSVAEMPGADFLMAIDEIIPIVDPHSTMIVFTGGEALLRKDIETIGTELYNRGFPWGIVTNGLLLNEKRLTSLYNSGLRAVTVSLDGLEDSHNWLRRNEKSFSAALNAVRLLNTCEVLKYDVVTCVNRKNFGQLDDLKHLLVETGVKDWRIFTVFPIGRAAQYDELQLHSAEFKKLFDFIAATRKEGKINLSYGCEGFLGSYESEVRDGFFYCRAGINIASILADGSISACPNLRENFIQGNIYTDNFREVWENRFQIYRNRNWTKKGICASCEFYKYCEGNGLHLHKENTGELLFCHLNRIAEGEKEGGL